MKEAVFAFKKALPVLCPYAAVGFAFGILMERSGFSLGAALFSAFAVYAGAVQILLISLFQSQAPLYVYVLMTLFINGRHVFYGLGLLQEFRSFGKRKYYMIATLTDEVYSVLCSLSLPPGLSKEKTEFLIFLFCHTAAIIGPTVGYLCSGMLTVSLAGIEFAAAALFLSVAAQQWKRPDCRPSAGIGLFSSLLLLPLLGADYFLLPALFLSLLLLLLLRVFPH